MIRQGAPSQGLSSRHLPDYEGIEWAQRHDGDERSNVTGRRIRVIAEGETYPWLGGGTIPEHEGRTDPTRVTRADAHHYARLPLGGVQGWRAYPHAQPGCPTRGAPPAAARQLLLLTRHVHLLN